MTFAEVRRGLTALSSLYVERRSRIGRGAALDGRGKRAAFALFYGPVHFVIVRRIVVELGLDRQPAPPTIVDLGCGTGASGAAWAVQCNPRPTIEGVDLHPWALEEATRTWSDLGLSGRARRGTIDRVRFPAGRIGVIAGWSLNELDANARDRVLAHVLAGGTDGLRALVVEPVARGPAPWWDAWAERFTAAGGRADTWRFEDELPAPVRDLDRAAGLDHARLTARSLSLR